MWCIVWKRIIYNRPRASVWKVWAIYTTVRLAKRPRTYFTGRPVFGGLCPASRKERSRDGICPIYQLFSFQVGAGAIKFLDNLFKFIDGLFNWWNWHYISYKCLHGLTPEYLSRRCVRIIEIPGRAHLRSASAGQLVVPFTNRKTLGDKGFFYADLTAWNNQILPCFLRDDASTPSLNSFRKQLKTCLFQS